MELNTAIITWCDRTLNPRPGYYAGRGPKRGDLNDKHLQQLWAGIKKDFGDEQAAEFVKMVADLKDMSATAFLVSMEHFWAHGLKWTGREQEPGDGNTMSARGDDRFTEGMCVIASVLGRQNSSPEQEAFESYNIKAPFLRRHGVEIEPPALGGEVFGYR